MAHPWLDRQTDTVCGAALFADISGFTPLTEALTRSYGARRGADALVDQINRVYDALIDQVHRYGGSVIGFSGDAITCWFDVGEDPAECVNECADKELLRLATQRALWAGCAIQVAMQRFDALAITPEITMSLAVKTSIAGGHAQRYLVGDPEIQLIDVLAGRLLDRMATGEQIAQKGETILDSRSADLLKDLLAAEIGRSWSNNCQRDNGYVRLSKEDAQTVANAAPPTQLPSPPIAAIPTDRLRPWLLPAVYQQLQASRGAAGSDRYLAEIRPATALFVRFSGLDYDNDANAGALLDRYICWVQNILQRYQGSLIQITTGDKGSYFYATFGAPIAHEDDSARAAAAAIDLLTPPAELTMIEQIQIGIAQGRMRVGAYGSRTRRTYGVIGDATNLAARLMIHAKAGEILAAADVAEEIDSLYLLENRGLVHFKGKDQPQQIYRVVRRAPPQINQFETLYANPLVGRDAELAEIDKALMAVQQTGSGHILRIEGEAGVGKSHLAVITTAHAQENQLVTLVGACQSTSRDSAYAPLRQIVRQLLELPAAPPQNGDEQKVQIEQIHRAVEQMNPEWLLRLPLLGDLLGLPIPENATTAAFDAQLRQEALTALTLELLQVGTKGRPHLLLVEDVHWIDESSQNILVALGRVIAETPILLLLVHRPRLGDQAQQNDQFLTEIAELPAQTTLLLDELSLEGSSALVQDRTHGPVAALALDLIYAQAQGNPFFTEELVDTLVESGRLTHDRGQWRLSESMINALHGAGCLRRVEGEWILASDAVGRAALSSANLGVPDTVHGIVLSRLDRLPEAIKLTIKVASVIGRIFDFDLLAQTHPEAQIPDILLQQIGTLENRDFAQIEVPAPHRSYIFKHNITQEVVYGTLLDAQRKELHLRVAQTLEAQQPDAVERLAHHFYSSDLRKSDVRSKALAYLDAAGQRAKRDYANETALSYFDRALALEERWQWLKDKVEVLHILGRREEERETLEQLEKADGVSIFDAAYLWGEYYESIGEYESAEKAIRRAMAAAEKNDDEQGALRCQIQLADVALRRGDYQKSKRLYEKALELIAEQPGFGVEQAQILYGLGIIFREQEQFKNAILQLQQCLQLYQQLEHRQGEADTLMVLGLIAYRRHDFKEAQAKYEQVLTIHHTIGNRTGEAAGYLSLATVMLAEGDYVAAEALLRKTLVIQQVVNNRWREAGAWSELSIPYMRLGLWSAALESIQHGLDICQEIGAEIGRAYILCNLGEVQREMGELEDAVKTLETGLLIAQSQGNRYLEALYLSELASIDMETGSYKSAIERTQRALEIKNERGDSLASISELSRLSLIHLNLNDSQQAITLARQAIDILATCDGKGIHPYQRDYYLCYQVFAKLSDAESAAQALQSAYALMMEKASKITDPNMRHSFLTNVPFNRDILVEAERQGLTKTCAA